MNVRFRLRTLLLVVTILAVLAGLGSAWVRARGNRVTIRNRSGQTAKMVSATVCNQRLEWRDVPDGELVSGGFGIKGDGHFTLEITLADDTRLTCSEGYVTGGMKSQADFTLLPNGKHLFHQDDRIGFY